MVREPEITQVHGTQSEKIEKPEIRLAKPLCRD
jgi:hypothetical protein